MATSEGSVPPKRARRPRCPQCGQVLTKSLFDRCVWCGAELPEELRLTDEEKTRFYEQQKENLAEAEAAKFKRELGTDIYSPELALKGSVHRTGNNRF